MKVKLVFCLVFLVNMYTFGQAKKVKVLIKEATTCQTAAYKMVFHDEFEVKTFDASKWFTYYPVGPASKLDSCDFCRTHVTANIYRDENCTIEDGKLFLKSDAVKGEWFGKAYDYTSGMVCSKQKFNTYGKYEIRCNRRWRCGGTTTGGPGARM